MSLFVRSLPVRSTPQVILASFEIRKFPQPAVPKRLIQEKSL